MLRSGVERTYSYLELRAGAVLRLITATKTERAFSVGAVLAFNALAAIGAEILLHGKPSDDVGDARYSVAFGGV